MNYERARAHAKAGAMIKRSLWDTWLRQWPDGTTRFILPENLRAKLGNSYVPHASDVAATDWQAKQ